MKAMHPWLRLSSVILFGGLLQHACGAPAPEILSRKTAQPPVIDGRLDDPAWRAAERIDRFFRYSSDEDARIPSVVHLMHDDQMLYIGMVMMKSVGQPVKGQLWRDCVEVFVDPGRSREDCYQMAFAIDRDFGIAYRRGIADLEWQSGAQWKAREIPLGWLLEAAIPLARLGAAAPAERATWGLLICRNDVDHGRMTLAPIRGAFRQPHLFCPLTLTGKPAAKPRGDDPPVPDIAGRIANSRQAVESLAAANPARGPILAQLAELSSLSDAIARETGAQPLIAPVIGRWAHASIAAVLDDTIDWRIRMGRLLFIQPVAKQ